MQIQEKLTRPKAFLTLLEAEAETEISTWTLRRDIKLKRLACHRRNRRGKILIARADLEAYLGRHRIAAIGE